MNDQTWSYADFAERARQLLVPLAGLMQPGESHLPIEGPPSNHGDAADRFEAFARPCLLASLWLHAITKAPPPEPEADALPDPSDIAAWFRQGLVLGTDPSSAKFWGVLPSFHQFAVEMAILVMALDIAGDRLWDPLADSEKQQVADWLSQIRGHAGHHNNHLFFDLLVLEFLEAKGFGSPDDRPCIDWLFDELETMYRGDGWFIDGTNETYDHYNAYAFHIYGLYWVSRFGHLHPARAERWKAWAHQFLPTYARFFSARGEPVPFGRSLTYRFNGVGVFPLAASLGIGSIDPGVARRICRRCIDFFLSRPIEQSQGCLSIGWTDEFHGVSEPYSCAGSPYWAAKGFLMLLLEPDDPFFTAPEKPMPSETDAPPLAIPAAGCVVRNIRSHHSTHARSHADLQSSTPAGEVELLNAGGWSSFSAAARFGQWKWGRIAYRTGIGSIYAAGPDGIPPDAGLTATTPADPADAAGPNPATWFGRHKTIPIHCDPEHLAAKYTLSAPGSGFNVSVATDAWWRDGAILHIHRVRCFQPTRLRTGAFAVHGAGDSSVREAHPGLHASAAPPSHQSPSADHATAAFHSSVTAIAGWHRAAVVEEAVESPRRHLVGPGSRTPVLEADLGRSQPPRATDPAAHTNAGEHILAEIIWAGPGEDPVWQLDASEAGRLTLRSRPGQTWAIEHERIPALR